MLLVAGVGTILVTIRSGTLHNPPFLVEDKEDSEGRTVSCVQYDIVISALLTVL